MEVVKMKKEEKMSYVMIAIVCLLLVVSVVQTFQVNALEEKMGGSEGGFIKSGQAPALQQGAPAAQIPAMVGGC